MLITYLCWRVKLKIQAKQTFYNMCFISVLIYKLKKQPFLSAANLSIYQSYSLKKDILKIASS